MSPAKKKPARTKTPPRRHLLHDRIAAGPLSSFELAELLGVHHGDLNEVALLRQSVQALIDLAHQVDLHPADLVPELEPVLALRRFRLEPPAHEPCPQQPESAETEQDAAVLLSALAIARGPLSAGALATTLAWPLERTQAALDLAADTPDLASPLALRRAPNGAYTLSPRLDLLTPIQHARLDAAPDLDAFTFSAAHTAVLLAAAAAGRTDRYADWKRKYDHEHDELVDLGVLIPVPGAPDHVEVHPDVLYSLHGPDTRSRDKNAATSAT